MPALELSCVRLDFIWALPETCELFESFWPDILPVFMPSLEAAWPPDIFVLVPAAIPGPLAPLVWVLVCALAPADPFSTAQEGVAAAKAIAPTTPSMSGSFITALFMIAPPVLRPTTGHVAT
jgi:hypothetical protein